MRPEIQMYRSESVIIQAPVFRETMSHKRFLQISKYLHFANYNMVNRRVNNYKKYIQSKRTLQLTNH